MDGAPACPFVAFGDDREARSTSPDHRHRCFAESPAGAARARAPGGVLPLVRLPGLPDLPGLGASRGRPRSGRGRPAGRPAAAGSRDPAAAHLRPVRGLVRPGPGADAAGPGAAVGPRIRRRRGADPAQPAARLGRPATVGHRRGDRRGPVRATGWAGDTGRCRRTVRAASAVTPGRGPGSRREPGRPARRGRGARRGRLVRVGAVDMPRPRPTRSSPGSSSRGRHRRQGPRRQARPQRTTTRCRPPHSPRPRRQPQPPRRRSPRRRRSPSFGRPTHTRRRRARASARR